MSIDFSKFQIAHLSDDMHSVLREKRVVLGLTQQQVADKAKIKLIQYQRFERGERNIMTSSFRIACRVIEALGMNVSDFYHGKYAFGEKIFNSPEGFHFQKTGKLISDDVL